MRSVNNNFLPGDLHKKYVRSPLIAVNLASRGYAEKIPDPSDGRGTLYSLTKAGETFIQEHISLSNAHFLQFLDSLDERNRVKLINALNDLDEVFCDSKNV